MNHLKVITRLTIVLISLLSSTDLLSQQSQSALNNQPKYLPAATIIENYEKLHKLRIYFKPEWFIDKRLDVSNLGRPLNDFLYVLEQTARCSTLAVDSTTFVLVENRTTSISDVPKDANSEMVIGRMEEYGKYKKATITGTVFNGKTDEPLPGVSLYVEKLRLSATTDKSGRYSLELPVGEHQLSILLIGFEPTMRRIKLVSNGNADFSLFDKSINLHEVIISQNRAEYNVSRTQMSLVRLDSKDIKELPLTLGEADLLKSITLLPGIQSSGEFGTGFFVRGGGADQNLILIEDVPIFNSSHLFGLTSIVNPEGIASVTLLKGGIPARYGERASSVIDIRMGPGNMDRPKVRGGIGLINSKISMDLPVSKKMTLSLGGRSSYSNWLLHRMPDLDLMNSSAGFYDMNGLLTYTLNPNNKITLFGYYSNDKFSIKNAANYSYGNALGSIKWVHVFDKALSSVLTAGLSSYDYHYGERDTIRPGNAYKINSALLYKSLKYNINWIPWLNSSFDFGINAIHYSIKPGELKPYDSLSLIVPIQLQKEQALEYALYASDNINITPNLSTEVGIRYSGYRFLGPASVFVYNPKLPRSVESITDTVYYGKNKPIKTYLGIEPRVSLRYSFDENGSVKLSYNRINQYINLVSNTAVMNPADVWKLSNSYIKPLVCEQYAVGYFRNFKKNMYETSIEIYYKKLNHIIDYKDGASLILNTALDADLLDVKGYNYGAEIYINKSSGRLTGWLSYSYSASKRHTYSPVISEQINKNNYYPSTYDKPHTFNMVGNYHLSRRWRFSWTFTYSTGRPVTLPILSYKVGSNELIYYSDRNKYRLPDYHRLDIAITCDESLRIKKFWKGSWTFSIINLYGRKNVYSVFFQKDTPTVKNNFKTYNLYALYIIGQPLPTLTYNFTF